MPENIPTETKLEMILRLPAKVAPESVNISMHVDPKVNHHSLKYSKSGRRLDPRKSMYAIS